MVKGGLGLEKYFNLKIVSMFNMNFKKISILRGLYK